MHTMSKPRIPPVTQSEWNDAVLDIFEFMGGPEARTKGSPFNVVTTMAQHPDIAYPHLVFYKALMSKGTLTPQLREVITLRVAWRTQSEYEWVQHVKLGKRVGLTDEHIEAAKVGPAAAVWSELESLAVAAVDQLFANSQIDDATWNGLAKHLNRKQLFDVLFVIGTYVHLCWAFNAMGVQLDASDPTAPNPILTK